MKTIGNTLNLILILRCMENIFAALMKDIHVKKQDFFQIKGTNKVFNNPLPVLGIWMLGIWFLLWIGVVQTVQAEDRLKAQTFILPATGILSATGMLHAESGKQNLPFHPKKLVFHPGIDYVDEMGTKVIAPASGKIPPPALSRSNGKKQAPLKEDFVFFSHDPGYRLPLNETVFHDSFVLTHHYRTSSLKFSNMVDIVELTSLLYMRSPMYHFNIKELKDTLIFFLQLIENLVFHKQGTIIPPKSI